MATSGSRIKKIRETKNMSQKELATALGYKTYTTISKWEANSSLPPGNELKKLAKFFDVSADYLLGTENYSTQFMSDKNPDIVEIDYIDSFNPDFLHTNKAERTIKVPKHILKRSASAYFVLKVQTDSINRIIPNGINVVVLDYSKLKDPLLQTGDIIVTKIDNEYMLYYLRKTDCIYYFETYSFIEGYENKEYTEKELENIEIIGKVIYSFRLFD